MEKAKKKKDQAARKRGKGRGKGKGPLKKKRRVIIESDSDDLKSLICDIKKEMPDLGQSMLKGVLESRGVHVPMIRIRECLLEIDPVNTALQWATPYIQMCGFSLLSTLLIFR